MKWVTRGTIVAIAPFTLFYILPYLFGFVPTAGMKVSVLSLVFLPLTFGYAIFRYRLMDVDLIFKRGMAYTLAAAAVVGCTSRSWLEWQNWSTANSRAPDLRPDAGDRGYGAAVRSVKKWIQDGIDKFFYRTRYDYRKTLIEFGRELSSETDLDRDAESVVDRLSRTLLVDRLAIFLATGEPDAVRTSPSRTECPRPADSISAS